MNYVSQKSTTASPIHASTARVHTQRQASTASVSMAGPANAAVKVRLQLLSVCNDCQTENVSTLTSVTHIISEVDHCESNPCIHGNCENHPDIYVCKCDHGWSGENCDQGNKLILLFSLVQISSWIHQVMLHMMMFIVCVSFSNRSKPM